MRKAFAHDAVLVMAPNADARAPGAAITTAVCGHWDHDGPCHVAPHYTHTESVDDELRLHVLFASEPEIEQEIREKIEQALRVAQTRLGTLLGSCNRAVLGLSLRMRLHTAAA